jgi:hypothetical protein
MYGVGGYSAENGYVKRVASLAVEIKFLIISKANIPLFNNPSFLR